MKAAILSAIAIALSGCASSDFDNGISLCDSEITDLGGNNYVASPIHLKGCGYEARHAKIFCNRKNMDFRIDKLGEEVGLVLTSKTGTLFRCVKF